MLRRTGPTIRGRRFSEPIRKLFRSRRRIPAAWRRIDLSRRWSTTYNGQSSIPNFRPLVTDRTMRTDRLFPLYLAPLERFFLADVGPEHPMTFTIRLDLTGVVRREAFERAIAAALKRHPLLHAYVRKAKRNRPCWVHAGDGKPSIDWRSAEDPVICENGEHICLDRETGLRVWVRQASETAIVVLQFHHACTDGIGAYRFIGDLLASYGLEVGGTEPLPRLEPVEPAQLRERFAVQVELWASNDRWGQLRRGLGQLWRLIRNRPRRLPPRDSSAATAASFPGFFTRSLEADEHEALRQAAQQPELIQLLP